jgi:mannose-6-phosphate isomerase-like protein (cupin superfamily)
MTLTPVGDLDSLQLDVADAWKSFDVATVNGNAVRFRLMRDVTARWHIHECSDELFYVISGTVYMETGHDTREIRSGQVFVVPAGIQHRARVEGRAAMLVVDKIS